MDFAVTGGEDDPVDEIGYIGKTKHEREKVGPLKDISHSEFIYTIYKLLHLCSAYETTYMEIRNHHDLVPV